MSENNDHIAAYYDILLDKIHELRDEEKEAIIELADVVADAVAKDKLLYTFGSGHSYHIAGELFWRAGGLAPVVMIEDPSGGKAERVEGYAYTFFSQYNVQPGDIVFVVSNSGTNPSPIDVALLAKEKGAIVVAICSLDHAASVPAKHSCGKKLHEISDFVLNNHGVPGDSIYPLSQTDWKICPTSTIMGCVLINALIAQVCETLLARGTTPPVLISANIQGGDVHNKKLADRLWPRLAKFPRLGTK